MPARRCDVDADASSSSSRPRPRYRGKTRCSAATEISGLESLRQRDGILARGNIKHRHGEPVDEDEHRADQIIALGATFFAIACPVAVVSCFGRRSTALTTLPIAVKMTYDSIRCMFGLRSYVSGISPPEYRNGITQWFLSLCEGMEDNEHFYGETVGCHTAWSSAISAFYTLAVSGHIVRLGWCSWSKSSLGVVLSCVVVIQSLFHVGLVRIHSMLPSIPKWTTTGGRILRMKNARHATICALTCVACAVHCFLWSVAVVPQMNVCVKLVVDGFVYCLRLFLVDDPMFTLVPRCANDGVKMVETYALQHLMCEMLCDFVMTAAVILNPELHRSWTQADLCVQVIAVVVLGIVSHQTSRPLHLERHGLSLKNFFDFLLKVVLIVAHVRVL